MKIACRGLDLVWPYLKHWRHKTSCCIQLSAGRPGLKPTKRSYTMSCDCARIRMQFRNKHGCIQMCTCVQNRIEHVMACHAVAWTSAHVSETAQTKSRNSERSEKGNDRQRLCFPPLQLSSRHSCLSHCSAEAVQASPIHS